MSVERADQKKEEEPVKTEREGGKTGRQKAQRGKRFRRKNVSTVINAAEKAEGSERNFNHCFWQDRVHR